MKSIIYYFIFIISPFKEQYIILICVYSPDDDDPSTAQFNQHYTKHNILSDDVFDQVDELFEGSDEDKLKAYEILINLNEDVSNLCLSYCCH